MSLEYKVVGGWTEFDDFEEAVRDSIKTGWEPSGGITTRTTLTGVPCLYQAMTRRIKKQQETDTVQTVAGEEIARGCMGVRPQTVLKAFQQSLRKMTWSEPIYLQEGDTIPFANMAQLADFVRAVEDLYTAAKAIEQDPNRVTAGAARRLDAAVLAFEGVKVSHEVQAQMKYVHGVCGQTLSFPAISCAACWKADPIAMSEVAEALRMEQQG